MNALRAAGLLEQVGPSLFRISDAATEWLESDDPLDLVRLFHSNFVGVGELLTMLDSATGAGELARRLEAEYGIARLTTNEIARRLRILEAAGLVLRVTQFSCRILPLGEAFCQTLPLMQQVQGSTGSGVDLQAGAESDDGVERLAQIERLSRELLQSSTDISNTTRFERSIADVFNHLGFSASHIGGPGKTDVLIEAWLAPGITRTIAVDAKTAASGVKDTIEFNVLREHRKLHKAAVSVVVAPGFDARLLSWEKEEDVALISANALVEILALQAAFPIPVSELAQMFNVDEIDSLREKWAAVKRQQEILSQVVATLWRTANNTGHVQASGGALTARDLWLMTMADESAASQEEIAEVLHFLASPLVNAVTSRKNESKVDSYSALSSPSSVAARLGAIRSAINGGFRPEIDVALTDVENIANQGHVMERGKSSEEQASAGPDPVAVRRWAAQQGMQVAHRGRLPSHLVEKYRRAHPEDAT